MPLNKYCHSWHRKEIVLIQIKQPDIEAAIKAHLQSQGISMQTKKVSITFTAGRKSSGLSAEVAIEEYMPIIPVISVEPRDIPDICKEDPLQPVATPANLFN